MTTRAAVYVRISFDSAGEGLGVSRQEADCRALAERNGWTVVDVYPDNDTSAYNGRVRKHWERLMADVRAGAIDRVLAWHTDRLTRRPVDLEDLLERSENGTVYVHTAADGMDTTTISGRTTLRILAAIARQESEHKGERQRRQIRQAAENGKRHRSRHRGYGFTRVFDDPNSPHRRVVEENIDPDEAAVIRECAARLLSGESLISVVRDLNRRGITTAQGKQWQTVTLKSVLCSARISGRREMMLRGGGSRYVGEIVAEGCWPAIISTEDSDRLRAMLTNPARRTSPGNARRYMLSGVLVCSRCERPMVARPRNDSSASARYLCRSDPGHGGCGKTYIHQENTDVEVRDQVITALDNPELVERLRRRDNPEPDLHARIRADEDKLEELAGDYGREEITRAEWRAAREPIEARLSAARARLARTSHTSALDSFVGTREEMLARWKRMNVSQRRAVVTACVESITVHPAKVAGHFDADRLDPVWR